MVLSSAARQRKSENLDDSVELSRFSEKSLIISFNAAISRFFQIPYVPFPLGSCRKTLKFQALKALWHVRGAL